MRSSLIRLGRSFIGPSHPISNIRPVLHNFTPPADNNASSVEGTTPVDAELQAFKASPYDVDEFTGAVAREGTSIVPASKDEWSARWMNVENDRINHLFWLDVRSFSMSLCLSASSLLFSSVHQSNTRFNAAKEALVKSYAALPLSPEQSQEDRDVALDQALARFYRGWQDQEEQRQRKYTMQMYRRTWDGIAASFLSHRWVAALIGR